VAVFDPVFPDLWYDAEELSAGEALRFARIAERPVTIMVRVVTGMRAVGSSATVIVGSGDFPASHTGIAGRVAPEAAASPILGNFGDGWQLHNVPQTTAAC
jgi:hypothetical protein